MTKFSFLDHLTGDQASDWREFLSQAARGVGGLRENPDTAAAEAAFEAMVDAMELTDGKRVMNLKEAALKIGYSRFEWGVLVGAALVRCWPEGPEGIALWARRVEEFLDFRDPEDGDPPTAA